MGKMDYAKIVGGVVRLHRELKKIDLSAMAEAMGMSPSGWSRVETGDTTITVAQLRKSAQKLGMEPWSIVQQADLIEASTAHVSGKPEPRGP